MFTKLRNDHKVICIQQKKKNPVKQLKNRKLIKFISQLNVQNLKFQLPSTTFQLEITFSTTGLPTS